jgi:hypothetical protein
LRSVSSYFPRPRPRSQSPTSIAAPHMAWQDNRSGGASCPVSASDTDIWAEGCSGSRRRGMSAPFKAPRLSGLSWECPDPVLTASLSHREAIRRGSSRSVFTGVGQKPVSMR